MINSEKYWDDRFKSGSWDEFEGEKQTAFFTRLLIENLPLWLKEDIEINRLSLLDAGCAKGGGTFLLKKEFSRSNITGIDFSKSAIDFAINSYPTCIFECKDINKIEKKYDIVISSNVLEHFINPYEVMENMFKISKKYFILLLPFQEENLEKEHFTVFNYNAFRLEEEKFYLSYYKVIDTSKLENTMWPGKQIMLVYANSEYLPKDIMTLSRMHNNDFEEKLEIQSKLLEQTINNRDIINKFELLDKTKINLEKTVETLELDKINLEKTVETLELDKINLEKQVNCQRNLENAINTINEEKQNIYNMYKSVFEEATKYQNTLQDIYNSNMWRLASRYYRIRDKVNIFKWFHKNIQKNKITKIEITSNNIDDLNDKNEKVLEKIEFDKSVYQDYKKQDIIILSVIDWDFRFQRPQHIAENMARLGHRVFYFNANYVANDMGVSLEKENLYVVTLNDSYGNRIYDINFNNNSNLYKIQINEVMHRYHIRDCSVIVEYPTWYPVAKYLKKSFGCNIIFDYIDDYTGFEETTNAELIKTTEKLLNISNVTIATSLFLYEKAKLYTENVEIVRNGTEFKFFNNAKSITKNKTSKIGYYGAIAEWFDIEKIAYIAQNRPDVEIELIGNVSHKPCNELKKYKNIKFLGEKNYKELPNYLKSYDVCLIPFRADIDLIKATNPVKFYEYLSAGKKIVATEIPELEPFRNEYVYLANDNEEFLKYINRCLDNNDDLASESELIDFAKKQDWNNRCKQIDTIIKNSTPLVSVILVTYNNIEYTKKCIKSIFQKTAYPNYEIIIVDNLSVDGTQDYLKELEKEYDNITIILNDDNLGFAAGNNVGIKACKGQYIILLNNDTVVTRGWITSMIKHLDKNNIGMVGPVTNSIGNESQINVTYKDINDMDEFALNYTTLHHDELYENIQVLAMFCVAIKRDVLEKVGLLDENYKIGMFEDDDYSIALRLKGYEVACVEDVFIHHFGNASFKKLEDKKYREIFDKNKEYFESKWNVLWTPHKYRDGVEL